MLGDDDRGVSLARHQPGQPLQQAADRRRAALAVADPEQVVAPKGHHEWQALGQGEQPALAELGVDDIVAFPGQPAPQTDPGGEVAERVSPASEGEDLEAHARGAEKPGLARNEVRGVARLAGPFARDHEDAQGRAAVRRNAHVRSLGTGRGTSPTAGALRSSRSRYSMKSLSISRLSNSRSAACRPRSEEHTSELQSPCNLVCRLLLEKKNKNQMSTNDRQTHGR